MLGAQMKMNPITTKQFIWWLVVTGFGVMLWIVLPEPLFGLACGVLCLSGLILQIPGERHEPIGRKQAIQIVSALAVVVVAILALRHWVSDEQGHEIVRFMKHPGFILPIWLYGIWLTYRRWQVARHHGETTAQPITGANAG
jgi:hypothetical protein